MPPPSSRFERVAMIGTRSANSIRASGQRPHTKAAYMTALDTLAETPKKPLPRGGRPYMTDAYELAFSTVTARRFCDQQLMSLHTATGRSLP
jgi:hypothetical protein